MSIIYGTTQRVDQAGVQYKLTFLPRYVWRRLKSMVVTSGKTLFIEVRNWFARVVLVRRLQNINHEFSESEHSFRIYFDIISFTGSIKLLSQRSFFMYWQFKKGCINLTLNEKNVPKYADSRHHWWLGRITKLRHFYPKLREKQIFWESNGFASNETTVI